MQSRARFRKIGEIELSHGLIGHDGHGIREVQRACFRNHRDAHAVIPVLLEQRLGDAGRFLAEHQHIVHRVRNLSVRARRLRRTEVEIVSGVHGCDLRKVLVVMHLDEMPVVEPGALEVLVIRREAQRLDEMKLDARRRTEAGDVPRIARNLRFYQYYMQCLFTPRIHLFVTNSL